MFVKPLTTRYDGGSALTALPDRMIKMLNARNVN
jgi:hypothetical protein